MSITFPTKMHFFRLAPTSGALPETIAGVVFGSLPGVLTIYVMRTNAERAGWVVLLMSLLSGTLYFFATVLSGKRFELKREKLAWLDFMNCFSSGWIYKPMK